MSDQIQIPNCTSCSRPILPGSFSVKFFCPACNETIIWRCRKCRTFSRTYSCSDCGFQGP